MHRSRLGEITIDCLTDDLEEAANFWARVLGYRPKAHEDHFHLIAPPDEVQINVQQVKHEPRVHIDLETDDIEAEVARLTALGAERERKGRRWVVMRTPTGHGICVCRPARSDFEENANQWP
ncbi:MAG: hypothetical protein DHS20C05_12660 [Hyphococcus sp.]|nr:MAG: hypothetical protein DHS20C05_12660 [Marinicaulis sp.]